jgi:hypothetical protein
MNYLSSSNYFHIKNLFSILFIQFKCSLDWASIPEKPRGLGVSRPRHREQLNGDGGLIPEIPRVSLTKSHDEGVFSDLGRPICFQGT